MVKNVYRNARRLSACIFVAAFSLLGATLLFPKSTHATTLPVVHESGALSSNTTWSAGSVYMIDNTVTITSGITLIIDAGAIVKVGSSTYGVSVQNGGTLDVNGTALNATVFTSYADDSYGGDSNADGASTGSYNNYWSTIQLEGGTVSATYAHFAPYGPAIVSDNWGCSGTLGDLTITDSEIDGSVSDYHCAANVDVERNAFAVPAAIGRPLSIGNNADPTGVKLAGLNENTFSGTPFEREVSLSGTLPSGETLEVDAASGAILRPNMDVYGTLNLGDGTTALTSQTSRVWGVVNVGAGAIVKIDAGAAAFQVEENGAFNVTGTSASPTHFTSYKDDSLGGDTNNDGSSTPGDSDYNLIFGMNGGSVHAQYATFAYGQKSFATADDRCSGSFGDLSVTDSDFTSSIAANGCISAITLERNTFAVPASLGSAVSVGRIDDITGIKLSGADENTFSGSVQARTVSVYSSVPFGKTWTIDTASNAIVSASLTVDGTINIDTNNPVVLGGFGLTVNGVLNVSSGAILKLAGTDDLLDASSSGTLNFNGTSTSPVTITSYKDDSVGGDTNGDGSSSSPAAGDYLSAVHADAGATINTTYTNIAYATKGFYIEGGSANLASTTISNVTDGLEVFDGTVSYRGSFDNISDKAIEACSWGQSCTVDATHVNWNSSDPTYAGDNLVCGQVLVSPWIVGASTASAGIYAVHNCDNSPTPDIALANAASAYADAIASAQLDCEHALQDACDAASSAQTCLNDAVGLAAGQVPFTLPTDDPVSNASSWATNFFGAMATYFGANAETVVTGARFGYAADLLDTVSTIHDLAAAYNDCAP